MAYSEIDRLNGVIKLYYPTNKSVEKIEEWEEELNNYVVEIIPQNTLTLEQMKLLYVLFKQFSEGVEWYDIQLAKDYLKAEYGNIYELGEFSISPNKKNCLTIEQATDFIQFIIETGIENNVPMYILDKKTNIRKHIKDIVPDIQRYVISCLKSKRCAICGKIHDEYNTIDLHHWDSVASIGGYEYDDGLKTRFISLCREHHTEFHNIGKEEFKNKYHIDGVWLNEQLVYELLEKYPNHFKLFRKNLKDGYYKNLIRGE